MPNVRGLILAGGEGTRLRPLTYYFQKCMMPVGFEQKPVLEYIIRLFKHHNIDDIVLLVGYKHQQIVNYFDDGRRFGVKITYVIDDPEFRGSGNAIIHAYREGILSKEDCLIAYYGDILSNINLQKLVDHHLSSGAAVTVAMAKGYKIRVGTAEVGEDGRIRRFIEKPELETPACVGILAMSGEALEEMDALSREWGKRSLDLMGDVIPYLIERGRLVNAYITEAFWYDLGSIERYEKLSNSEVEEQLSFLMKEEAPKRPRRAKVS
ncbi:nucleotidyltransferase family protein [Candidatus Bathyarchaeota archaeon]|nr:nucleotidyltransferase family protein [Candidatus Bathyarchaeota archaeon]